MDKMRFDEQSVFAKVLNKLLTDKALTLNDLRKYSSDRIGSMAFGLGASIVQAFGSARGKWDPSCA